MHVLKSGGSSWDSFINRFYCGIDRKECDQTKFVLLPCKKAFDEFPDHFRFSFVRNPYQRALSMYQMAIAPGFLKGPSKPFNEWILNKSSLSTRVMKMHWLPQTHFLFTKNLCPVVDFIGKLENFHQDAMEVFRRINNHNLTRFFLDGNFIIQNASPNVRNKERDYKMISGRVEDEIYHTYKDDFDLLGYNRL
eukprot:767632-Hanusia_phi.AAC.3